MKLHTGVYGLMSKFLGAYVVAVFGGSCFIILNNIVILRKSVAELLSFTIPFLLISDFVFVLLLLAITFLRLTPVIRYFHLPMLQLEKKHVFKRLMGFPLELFWGTVLLSLLFISLFHTLEIVIQKRAVASIHNLIGLAETILAEISLALILSILLFSITRKLLRIYSLSLRIETLTVEKKSTVVYPIAIAVVTCFIITFSAAVRFIVRSQPDAPFDHAGFLLLSGVYTTFALAILTVYMYEIRQTLRMLIDALHALYSGTRTHMHQAIPIISYDEIGRLTGAFNALQSRVAQTYADVDQQLKLAYAIQQQLLPQKYPVIDSVEIAVSCQQCREVGGDYYDFIELGEHRYALAIGDVSGKGMPAALLMTAMLTGLRMEVKRGGTAGDILTRLNRHVFNTTQGNMYSTLGLALLDLANNSARLDYASAGHMDPYIIRDGNVVEWQCSSLPLGSELDRSYTGTEIMLMPGDIFVLYTDGVVEARSSEGRMIGFDWWEQELRSFTPQVELERQLSAMLQRFPQSEPSTPDDDRTIVMLRWRGFLHMHRKEEVL